MIKSFSLIFAVACVLTLGLLTFALFTSTSDAHPKLTTYQIVDVDCYEENTSTNWKAFCRSWSYKKTVSESYPTNHYDKNNRHIDHNAFSKTLGKRGHETKVKSSCSSCS